MTTIADLIDTTPPSSDGLPIVWPGETGWRGVFQIADPLAGSAVEWFDLSEYLLGYNLTKGASTFGGRPEATVANIEVMGDNGILAPTNPDTSALFGDHIDLGPGLLVRFSLIRVVGGIVVEWLPRFTLKVEYWGNASHARGRIRRHLIVARDTFTSLVDVPVAAAPEQDWHERVTHIRTSADWQYGLREYHDFDLLLPERDEQSSSVRELDAALDPAGLVWFTDRQGHLYIRPRPGDTLHAGAGFALPWLSFHYQATDATTGLIAYAVDYDAIEPFGLAKSETGVKNRVVITSPGGTFDQDDATSIQRFDPKVYRATWIAENDTAAANLLAYRAFAEMEATPLYTCIGQPGFHDLLLADYLNPAGIEHAAGDNEEVTAASGVVRRLEESAVFAGPCVEMSIKTTLDIESFSTVEGLILPVDDLTLDALGDTGAIFSWTNPTQVVTPTHTQIRMIGVTSIWSTYPYPITGLSWGGLTPATAYQFQVRLVQITDGVVGAASSIRLYNFVTTNDTTPGDGDGSGDVDVPDYGTCDTGWRLSEWNPATDTFDVVATGTAVGGGPVDVSAYLVAGTIYQMCAREDCAGVFGPWVCGPAWIEPDDWGVPCITPAAFDDPPFDDVDLIAYVPQLCAPATIREAVSGNEAEKGPAFSVVTNDTDGRPKIWSNEEGRVLQGYAGTALATCEDDATLCWRGKLGVQPTGVVTLASFGGLEIRVFPSGAGFRARAVAYEQVGGETAISGATVLPIDVETWINVTHDTTSDNLKLYIGQTLETSALGSVGIRDFATEWFTDLAEDSWLADVAVFGRVLAAGELPGPPGPAVTINKGSGQADPATTSPIVFDIVFSEAVSGFATGDVTLSGTAGATTAVVAGSGTTYTATVSGMTGTGTVIATIAAGVCVSVATSAANQASTSTDNNVQYDMQFHDLLVSLFGSDLIFDHDYGGYTSGANVQDLTANNWDANQVNTPGVSGALGPFSLAYPDLDGTNDYFGIDAGGADPPTDITSAVGLTIGILFRPEGTASKYVISKRGTNSTTHYQWAVVLNAPTSGTWPVLTTVYAAASAGAIINRETTTTRPITQNTIQLLVVTFPPTPGFTPRHKIYVNNGTPIATTQTQTTNVASTASNGQLTVGTEADTLSAKLDGQIFKTFAIGKECNATEVGIIAAHLDAEGWY